MKSTEVKITPEVFANEAPEALFGVHGDCSYKIFCLEEKTSEEGVVSFKYGKAEGQKGIPEKVLDKEIKRYLLSNIKVTTSNGNTFDGNETARNNMLSSILTSGFGSNNTFIWKLADNSFAEVSKEELEEALILSVEEVGRIVGVALD